MADSQRRETEYNFRFREDEELEFFTELALHESERWIQAVTKKSLQHPDDTRKSLENGVLLCELLNCLQPASVSRINRLPTPIAGLDNINVFLRACKTKFGLSDVHLFNPSDLEDLSQRAIAESAYLKQEYEKRLRNVAITIYWLGKYASRHYPGPQLDLSAYSALIHHHHEPEIVEQGFHQERHFTSRTSSISSGDWPHAPRSSTFGQHSTLESPNDSLDDHVSDVCSNMSMSHYSSASALNKNHEQPQTSPDQHHSSIPDLTNRGVSHRRYSSTDSLEGSYYSGQSSHSRQGSDGQEIIYPTRRLNTQASRKQSTSTDPLQFIKGKAASSLAHTAEVQMRVAAESKKSSVMITPDKEESAEWQAELNSWKSRRKSQSDRTTSVKEKLDQMNKEESEDTWSAPPLTKTYSQMQEARELRRNSRQPSYPIQDDGNDDDAFAPAVTRQSYNSLTTAAKSKGEKDSKDVDSDDYEATERETGGNNSKLNAESQSDTNNNFNNMLKPHNNVVTSMSQSTAHLSQTKKASDDDDDDNDLSSHRKSSRDNETKYWKSASAESWLQLQSDPRGKSSPSETITESGSRRHESIYKTKETFTTNKPYSERDVLPKKSNRNIGSRTQSKIGSILKNFEESSAKISVPKQGYNERVDLNARKSAFENVSENVYANGRSPTQSEEVMSDGSDSEDCSMQEIKMSSFSALTLPVSANITTASAPLSASTHYSASPAQVYSSTKDIDQGYVRKVIKISQKPNSERGFGFILSGGADKQTDLYVSKVSLGSAADVCDLKAGDVLISVNQTDVSAKTAAEVGDIVASSVCAGYIEIQVWREHGEDEFDDFTSSSDEGEASISSPRDITFQTQEVNVHSSDNVVKLEFETSSMEGRQSGLPTGGSTLLLNSSVDQREESEHPGYEPPAILRKWQQQQQQQKEEDPYDNSSDIYSQINLNSISLNQSLDPVKDLSETRETRMESSQSWDNQVTESYSKHETQDEQRPIDKTKLLEERRAERRARIMQSASTASPPPSHTVTPPSHTVTPKESDSVPVQHEVAAPLSANFSSSVNSNSYKPFQPSGFLSEAKFVIDPRNRQESSEAVKPGEFYVKRFYQTNTDAGAATLIEEERKRIRNEELLKLQEERQRAEEDLMNREKEEKIRRQKEEEKLKKERELLQLERERFLKEKEEFNRLKEQQNQQQFPQHRQHHQQIQETPYEKAIDNRVQQYQIGNSGLEQRIFQPIPQHHQSQLITEQHQTQPKSQHQSQPIFQQHQSQPVSQQHQSQPISQQHQSQPVSQQHQSQPVSQQHQSQPIFQQHQSQPIPQQHQSQPIPQQHQSQPIFQQHQSQPVSQQHQSQPVSQQHQSQPIPQQHQSKPIFQQHQSQPIPQKHQSQPISQQHQSQVISQQHQSQVIPQQHQSQPIFQHQTQPIPQQHQSQPIPQQHQSQPIPQQHQSQPIFQQHQSQPLSQQQESQPTYSSSVLYNPQKQSERQNHSSIFQPKPVHFTIKLDQTHNQNKDTISNLYNQPKHEQPQGMERSSSTSFLSKPPVAIDVQTSAKGDLESTKNGQAFSREDILSMNRTAKPMLMLSTVTKDSTDQPQWSNAPITREAPSREEIHSLNSVPKAKLRHDADWQSSGSWNVPTAPKSVSPQQIKTGPYKAPWLQSNEEKGSGQFSFTTAGDHWMIQEAERRRIAESEGRLQSGSSGGYKPSHIGPIKPAGDFSNRWQGPTGLVQDRDHVTERVKSTASMLAVIRKTLLQKTAGARSSGELVQSFSHSPTISPSFSYHENFHSQSLPAQTPQQHHQQQWQHSTHLESSRQTNKQTSPSVPTPTPQGQNQAPGNGSQRCSHCDQELGYGAAMVIESLGLFFHVQCFRCWVCHASLGTGDHGADVRVRVNKLHCPNCYSNDEVMKIDMPDQTTRHVEMKPAHAATRGHTREEHYKVTSEEIITN